MTLPPWLWRVLGSRKTRTFMKIGLCLGIAVGGGFYPVVNWWGRREFDRAEAEVRAKGWPVRERMVAAEEVAGSFFRQPAFLAEKALPEDERLGICYAMDDSAHRDGLVFSSLPAPDKLTPEEATAARAQLARYQSRRDGLIAATRRTVPLPPGDVRFTVPGEDARLALRLADYLQEEAVLAKVAGDYATALESFEGYFRIVSELLKPGVRHPLLSRPPGDMDRMVRDFVICTGCRGFNEGQLAKIDEILSGIDFPKLMDAHFRELPGECVGVHHEVLHNHLPDPRPAGSAHSVFSRWNWDPHEM